MPRKEKSRGIVDDDDVFDTASNAMVRKQVVDHLPRVLNAGVDFDGLSMPELDAANVESERVFFEHALVPCEHCGRRFRRDALRKHRVSCTAARPFSKPLARQTTEGRVKVSNWR